LPDQEFYFTPPELQRLNRINQRIPELNQQASGLLRRCLILRNRKQYQELVDSLEAICHELQSLQKRRQGILASANEPHPTKIIVDFGRRCEACKDLPVRNEEDDSIVLTGSEACPPEPKLDTHLDLADLAEQLLSSGLNSRPGFGTASLKRALSAWQSALLRQKAPLPRPRHSSLHAEAEFVVLHKRFECTYCGRPMRWEWATEDPRYVRALRRSRELKALRQSQPAQETYNRVEGEIE
jgi:hypothetical protein